MFKQHKTCLCSTFYHIWYWETFSLNNDHFNKREFKVRLMKLYEISPIRQSRLSIVIEIMFIIKQSIFCIQCGWIKAVCSEFCNKILNYLICLSRWVIRLCYKMSQLKTRHLDFITCTSGLVSFGFKGSVYFKAFTSFAAAAQGFWPNDCN